MLIGVVHSVPEVDGDAPAPAVKVGDKVLFAKYGATEVSFKLLSLSLSLSLPFLSLFVV